MQANRSSVARPRQILERGRHRILQYRNDLTALQRISVVVGNSLPGPPRRPNPTTKMANESDRYSSRRSKKQETTRFSTSPDKAMAVELRTERQPTFRRRPGLGFFSRTRVLAVNNLNDSSQSTVGCCWSLPQHRFLNIRDPNRTIVQAWRRNIRDDGDMGRTTMCHMEHIPALHPSSCGNQDCFSIQRRALR